MENEGVKFSLRPKGIRPIGNHDRAPAAILGQVQRSYIIRYNLCGFDVIGKLTPLQAKGLIARHRRTRFFGSLFRMSLVAIPVAVVGVIGLFAAERPTLPQEARSIVDADGLREGALFFIKETGRWVDEKVADFGGGDGVDADVSIDGMMEPAPSPPPEPEVTVDESGLAANR